MKIKDPSKKKANNKLPISIFELVWYSVQGAVALWGLTYMVLGLVAENLPTKAEDTGLVKANADFAKTFGLDFLGWGLIILAIGAVLIVICLLITANKSDRQYEKETRRAQRLAQIEIEEAKEDAEANANNEVVVEETPKAE